MQRRYNLRQLPFLISFLKQNIILGNLKLVRIYLVFGHNKFTLTIFSYLLMWVRRDMIQKQTANVNYIITTNIPIAPETFEGLKTIQHLSLTYKTYKKVPYV